MFNTTQAYTSEEVREALSLSRDQITRLIKNGDLNPVLVNGYSYRFFGADLLDYLANNTVRKTIEGKANIV